MPKGIEIALSQTTSYDYDTYGNQTAITMLVFGMINWNWLHGALVWVFQDGHLSGLLGFSSSLASAASGWVKVANETLSPKFDFMNSASFDFSSSGEGNGGVCSINCVGATGARDET